MTDPISYSIATARLGMPMLFAGQSQKETTVNEALALLDLILPGSVQGVRNDPPANSVAGEAWIVGSNPAGAFAGRANDIAGWTEGGWRFAQAVPGMRLYDLQDAAYRFFDGTWAKVSAPANPAGGATIDTEARAAIAALIAGLKATGTFSSS
ncbi:MAG: DUF2793 domain-containing protein [Novosphingobium sp.]